MTTETATTPLATPPKPTNTMAILSLVFAFLFWPLSLVFGHMARRQIKSSGEHGRGLATAGLVISYLGMAVFVLVLIVGAASVHHSAPSFQDTPPASVTAPDAPTGPVSTFGDGTYAVGSDINPGTYHTSGSTSSVGCYWARSSDTSGDTSSIVANNLGSGPATVTVSPGDKAFQTTGCNTWTKVG